MKLLTILGFLSLTSSIAYSSTMKMVPIDHIYIPQGFDSNDNVEIVVTGYLPNLCYKSPKALVQIRERNIFVTIKSIFFKNSNPYCPEMIVPFNKTVDIGALDKGKYNIIINKNTEYEKIDDIRIKTPLNNSVDNYQYAYVQEIQKKKNTIILKGYNPSDCYALGQVQYISNNEDVYSILPRMKKVREFCPMKLVPFTISWKIPNELDSKKILIHVRTLNGNSVNRIINNF